MSSDMNNIEKINALKAHGLDSVQETACNKYDRILHELRQMYMAKNRDYGDSFSKTYDDFGMIAAIVRLNDKMNRLNKIYDKQANVEDETVKDTLMDLANYAILTVLEMEN